MSSFYLKQLTFQPLVEEFIFDRQSKNRSKKTIQYYQNEIKYFLNSLGEMNQIEDLTSPMLRRYFIDLSSHRNKGGVHANYRAVKAFLNWYSDEYEVEWKNPIRKIRLSNNNIEPLPEIGIPDIQKLISVCHGRFQLRDIAILKSLVDTGCRANELLSLNIEDIDFSTGAVKVLHGKGDKARIVWLGDKSRKAIKEYLQTRENLTPKSPLFINDSGERLKFFGLRQVIIRLCKKAGLEKEWGLHAFRRTFAITLYRKGVDILSISRLLGHSSIEVTKRYLNINNEDLRLAHSRNSPADLL